MYRDLGDYLLGDGVVDEAGLKELRSIQAKTGASLDQIALKKGVADEETVVRLLAKQYDLSFEAKLDFHEDACFEKIPDSFIKRSRMIPWKRKQSTLFIALRDPTLIHFMDDLRLLMSDYRIEFVLTVESEISRLLHSHFDRSAQEARDVIDDLASDEFGDLDSFGEDTMDLANEAPIIRMVNAILSQGVNERASDIHIEAFEKNMTVRYRIDGILHKRLSPPRPIQAALISRIKIMSNLNIAENRLPQDGRIKLKVQGKDIDIRVSSFPTRHGERIVMRLLNKSDMQYSMETMGFGHRLKASLRTIIQEPNGILLVTGPTGSGKTTTLYAFLNELNQESRNILTAEDPVEYEMAGISQLQVQDKIGLTFASALRAMLRQDPDVIMVGEIRDQETARIAIQASLTGHLVLSTLHTNDAPSAVTRMMDMNIEPYLITSTVRAILAQRLVRVICPKCKTSYKPDSREISGLGLSTADLKGAHFSRGTGCNHCSNTGYRGRTGLFELFLLDTDIQRAILKGADSETLKRLAVERGMQTLQEFGIDSVLHGITTSEEVLRVT